ncbi:nascent polypeptide-associated complex subunit alpha, muscle-specific form-like [Choloepus didactylus]|uniref:nascent polypeptide-associated complex subunit alpha, muscle-specific form-like n=1 Tax=Choloepus didactylus TaxID=27675 RepID=UPI00189E77F4|nr:nascent polypeptide-associated complex subunit alpha, muscle-specific form-like [Choloepus didactylus]
MRGEKTLGALRQRLPPSSSELWDRLFSGTFSLLPSLPGAAVTKRPAPDDSCTSGAGSQPRWRRPRPSRAPASWLEAASRQPLPRPHVASPPPPGVPHGDPTTDVLGLHPRPEKNQVSRGSRAPLGFSSNAESEVEHSGIQARPPAAPLGALFRIVFSARPPDPGFYLQPPRLPRPLPPASHPQAGVSCVVCVVIPPAGLWSLLPVTPSASGAALARGGRPPARDCERCPLRPRREGRLSTSLDSRSVVIAAVKWGSQGPGEGVACPGHQSWTPGHEMDPRVALADGPGLPASELPGDGRPWALQALHPCPSSRPVSGTPALGLASWAEQTGAPTTGAPRLLRARGTPGEHLWMQSCPAQPSPQGQPGPDPWLTKKDPKGKRDPQKSFPAATKGWRLDPPLRCCSAKRPPQSGTKLLPCTPQLWARISGPAPPGPAAPSRLGTSSKTGPLRQAAHGGFLAISSCPPRPAHRPSVLQDSPPEPLSHSPSPGRLLTPSSPAGGSPTPAGTRGTHPTPGSQWLRPRGPRVVAVILAFLQPQTDRQTAARGHQLARGHGSAPLSPASIGGAEHPGTPRFPRPGPRPGLPAMRSGTSPPRAGQVQGGRRFLSKPETGRCFPATARDGALQPAAPHSAQRPLSDTPSGTQLSFPPVDGSRDPAPGLGVQVSQSSDPRPHAPHVLGSGRRPCWPRGSPKGRHARGPGPAQAWPESVMWS